MSALVSLSIEYLRGATTPFTLGFEQKKKLTVLYGENASGKSTVCDALELLGSRGLTSLENRGLGPTKRFWPSIGKSRTDVRIRLDTAAGSHTATVGTNDVVVTPEQDRPKVEVLRRRQVLGLMLAGETDRFSVIERFIDVSLVEKAENELKQAHRRATEDDNTSRTRLGENQATLEGFWAERGNPGGDAVTWARLELASFDDALNKRTAAAFGALVSGLDRTAAAVQQLRATRESAEAARREHLAIEDRLEQARHVGGDGTDTLRLLEAARGLLAGQAPNVCPLCGSSEKAHGLVDEIDRRLEVLEELRDASDAETVARQNRIAREGATTAMEESLHNAASDLTDAASGPDLPADEREKITVFPIGSEPDWDAWLDGCELWRSSWTAATDALNGGNEFIGALGSAVNQYDANRNDAAEFAVLVPALAKAHEVAMEVRRSYVDSILQAISKDVGELYEQVHPGEGLDKVSLQLNPSQRRALRMEAEFEGKAGLPPQAYFSDSHLDTLGLCIFLALARRDSPEDTILVLDDVLGSVDEPHVDRLIEMLYDVASGFRHCLLTTHYGPWKHKLRWGWLQNGQCQFVELGTWSGSGGMCLSSSMPDLERLKALLGETPPDRQLVCAKAGVILEAALNFLTLLYECPVPRKPEDRYTLGDLLPNVSRKLRDALKVERLDGTGTDGQPVYTAISLTPILDRLDQIAGARNLFGAHFKEISFEMLDKEAIEFGQLVVQLMEALTDAEAGWPKNGKSGSYWATAGETRRLHPLKRPS